MEIIFILFLGLVGYTVSRNIGNSDNNDGHGSTGGTYVDDDDNWQDSMSTFSFDDMDTDDSFMSSDSDMVSDDSSMFSGSDMFDDTFSSIEGSSSSFSDDMMSALSSDSDDSFGGGWGANPATGLPTDDMGIDCAGNPFGTDAMDMDNSFDGMIGGFDDDMSSSFGDSFSSFDDSTNSFDDSFSSFDDSFGSYDD